MVLLTIVILLYSSVFSEEMLQSHFDYKYIYEGCPQKIILIVEKSEANQKKVVFQQEIGKDWGYFISGNQIMIFKPNSGLIDESNQNSFYSAIIYQYRKNKMELIFKIESSVYQHKIFYSYSDRPYLDTKRNQQIAQDFLMIEQKIIKLEKNYGFGSIEYATRKYDLLNYANEDNPEDKCIKQWQAPKIINNWASQICKKKWDKNGKVDEYEELVILKKFNQQWHYIGAMGNGWGLPMRSDEIYKKFPGLDMKTAKKLGIKTR